MPNFQFSIFNSRLTINYRSVIVFGIILLAAFLRLYRVSDYMTFLGDEGRDVLVVYNLLHGDFTLLGPTASVGGFFLGPIYYYLMAPFLFLFNYNPVGPAVMVALFGVATVWLIYKVGSDFFNEKVGMIAALIYSFSPLVIAYSRSSWNPNLMPFFSILMLYTLYQAVKKDNFKLFILAGVFLGILMQLHYLTVFLGIIVALYLLISQFFFLKQKKILKVAFILVKKYFLLFLGFIIGWLPFLVFEIRHGFPNLRTIFNFVFNSGETGGNEKFLTIITDVFFRLFARLLANFPPPEQFPRFQPLTMTLWTTFVWVLAILSFLMLFFQLILNFKKQKENFFGFLLLFIWLFLGILLFGFYKKPIYDYYFGFMFTLPFLLVGNLLSSFLKQNFLFKIFSGIILLVILVLNLKGIPFLTFPNRQLAQVEQISKFVFQKTEGKPFNFALITGGNSDHAYRYFFKIWGRDPVIIQNSEIDPKRTSVTKQLLIICEIKCEPLGHPLWEVAGFGRAEIVGEWDVSVLKVYKLIPYKAG